jgi:hypothetical protein
MSEGERRIVRREDVGIESRVDGETEEEGREKIRMQAHRQIQRETCL